MKGKRIMLTLLTLIAVLGISVSPVLAAKPIDVQYQSNGFPSGQHFNLNLHGRDPATYTGTPDGNVVIVSINGSSTIEYLSNKKNMNYTDLVVLDPLAENFGPDYDPAQVYLPYNIVDETDNVTKSAQGYWVYGRILGTPNNGSNGPSTILLTQNFIVAAANSANETTDDWPFGFDPNLDMIGLGVITTQGNLYVPTIDGKFERFNPPTDPYETGKGNKQGKSKATDISELFRWTGYVSDNLSLDADGSGTLNITDLQVSTSNTTIRAEWLPFEAEWLDEAFYQDRFGISAPAPNGQVDDQNEFIAWLHWLSLGDYGVTEYNEAWVFDIADMVISGQTVVNDGTKNFQIRFYPVATTIFGEAR
jgi:hypothetical protein